MGIKICPNCGGKVSDSRNDCPHCQYIFKVLKKCPDCEEQIDDDLNMCPICGHYFDSNKLEIKINDNNVNLNSDEIIYEENVNDLKCPFCNLNASIMALCPIIFFSSCKYGAEKKKILKILNPKDYIITLEIEGKEIKSEEFAKKINDIFITHSNITFIIGGSFGLDDEIKEKSNFKLSFSKMTFPHQLFRVILLEQIYRGFQIAVGSKYHK